MFANGILLLYHHYLAPNANTIMEHVNSFEHYSNFKVWGVNTEVGFPRGLKALQFRTIVLHYSLFDYWPYRLSDKFLDYLAQNLSSYKIAFFQDEHRFCQPRFAFLNDYKIDCVYTLLEPIYFKDIYQKYTRVPELVYTYTGYVSDDLIALARKITKLDQERQIDIGYRARRLPFYMGKGSQEKHEIAIGFRERAAGLGMKMDIETDEEHRIYGRGWYEFLANCRAVLGVEAGVSLFDLEDLACLEHDRLIAMNPTISFEEMWKRVLYEWDDKILYRTISPRHFESAAFHVCQILFEGHYSGVMQPMVHYIPLKKDFSNFDEVIRIFKDLSIRRELTGNAYRDLIASGQYSYKRFIEGFDQQLLKVGLQPSPSDAASDDQVTALLNQDIISRQFLAKVKSLRHLRFAQPVMTLYRKLKQNRSTHDLGGFPKSLSKNCRVWYK